MLGTDGTLQRATGPTVLGTLSPVFRHVALFKWAVETTEEQKQAIRDGLGGLPSSIAELRDYRFGDDAGLVEANWDFAVVADFDDADGWAAYRDHPEHRHIVAEHIAPAAVERAAVQYET